MLGAGDPARAVAEMASRHVSAVLVVDGAGKAVGIVTERDAVNRWAAAGAMRRDIDRVMSSPVLSVGRAFIYTAIARKTPTVHTSGSANPRPVARRIRRSGRSCIGGWNRA
jgi:CBS domain-containing protein